MKRGCRLDVAQGTLLALLLFSGFVGAPLYAPHAPAGPPALPRLGSFQPAPAATPPNYDEQIGLTFTETFTSLEYNVTAVAQANSDGYGPAYLLNGLTDKGYWYQVGLSWNWNPGDSPGTGFSMNYEAWDTNGYSIFPTNGGGGLSSYAGPVNAGDPVELSLNFTGGSVVMHSKDLVTGAAASIRFGAEGASSFVGLIYPSNTNGYFTGLMTEEYHSSPYYGNVLAVNYSSSTPLANGWLWADEFSVSPKSTLFYGSKFVSFANQAQVQTFAKNGTTSYANARSFVTGALNEELLTLSYSVAGGGTGYAAPVLTYTLNGVRQTASLTRSPATFFADAGSNWQVTNSLPGSTTTERWQTSQPTSGMLTSSVDEALVYFHQYLWTFGFSVIGGGKGYLPPGVNVTSFETSVTWAGNNPLWVDAGSTYTYPATLSGSSSSERWASPGPLTGVISQPESITAPYYHQYGLALAYVVVGGGSPPPPEFSGTQFGRTFSTAVANATTYFLDPGTTWNLPTLLAGGDSQERWIAGQITNSSVTGPTGFTVPYAHQYNLTVDASPSAGGTTGIRSGWVDAGDSVQLSQSANQGWRFEGWNGSGTGSYSGSSNSTSIQMNSPIAEYAVFYPGLQITAGSDGGVDYSFGDQSGSVRAGSSTTVFAPVGATVTLRASPSSFLYSFVGWAQGATGSDVQTTIDLSSPTVVAAGFTLNITAVGGIALGAAVVVAAVGLALRRRGRSGS